MLTIVCLREGHCLKSALKYELLALKIQSSFSITSNTAQVTC